MQLSLENRSHRKLLFAQDVQMSTTSLFPANVSPRLTEKVVDLLENNWLVVVWKSL